MTSYVYSIYTSLHLLTANSQSILPPPASHLATAGMVSVPVIDSFLSEFSKRGVWKCSLKGNIQNMEKGTGFNIREYD